ncbi:MAG: metal-sensitive transcriptional regulator [Bacillota bacterium]
MNSIDDTERKKLLIRLKKIEGQIRGIQNMIEKDKYCADILTQISAVRGALKKVGLNILDSHTHGCVRKAVKKQDQDGEEILDELIDLFAKFTD